MLQQYGIKTSEFKVYLRGEYKALHLKNDRTDYNAPCMYFNTIKPFY